MDTKPSNRRQFIRTTGKYSSLLFLSSQTLGREGHTAPSDKLNIAGIGVGGKGGGDIRDVSTENIVAMCDVDSKNAAGSFERFPKAKKFTDFRVMFDKIENEFDAVVVSTPDHCHGVAAMRALKSKKHVFCQKPLAHSIYETRVLTETARQYGVQTQMGNQGHSSDEIRQLHEWIDDNAIGDIREVNAWSDRPVGGDPWSNFDVRSRPKDTPPIPDNLNWDLWLGPVKFRPYHPCYCPTTWRSWLAFGTGAIGDMGCHIMDPAFWALKLGSPEYVEASTTHWLPEVSSETYPRAAIVRYKFPARGNMPPVKLTWYDGRLLPPVPEGMENRIKLGNNGALFIGEKGVITHGSHGAGGLKIELYSGDKYKEPPRSLSRVPGGQGGHAQDWVRACKDGKPASSNFSYGGALTEMALLGVMAMQLKDQRLFWDAKNMKVKNVSEADRIIKPEFRKGWTL